MGSHGGRSAMAVYVGDCVTIPYRVLYFARCDNMSIWTRIKDYFLGVEFVSTTQIRDMMEFIIENVDTNDNGWISTRELIDGVKEWLKKN